MKRTRKTFRAPSPKDGKLRKWEALEEIGSSDPTEFISLDPGEEEQYGPGDEGYQSLLAEYKKNYPNG